MWQGAYIAQVTDGLLPPPPPDPEDQPQYARYECSANNSTHH